MTIRLGIYAAMRDSGGSWLTATEVAALIGVPTPTIRSWERRYGWPEPARTQGGHRRYSASHVEGLRAIRDEIAKGHSAQQAVILLRRQAVRRKGRYVAQLVDAAVKIDPWRVRRALADVKSELPTEDAIEGVILPSVREIGRQWEKGVCDVAGEHAATGQIRHWLSGLLEEYGPSHRAPTVVLATGPADFHSVGLEAFAVLLARQGIRTLVLGALTPVASLVQAVKTLGAAAAVVTCHMAITRRAAVDSITNIAKLPESPLVYYAGNGFATARSRRGVPGTYLGTDMNAAAGQLAGELLTPSEMSGVLEGASGAP